MKIIGHRGAAGLALENTLESITLARELGVDAIEFDVRITKDGKAVLSHDDLLTRTSNSNLSIRHATYAELKKIPLSNGSFTPTLEEALQAAGDIPVIVEIKVTDNTELICKILDKFPALTITVTSFHAEVIADMRKLRPKIPVLLAENQRPFSVFHTTRRLRAGLNITHWILNPLTYWTARRTGMTMMVHTVDNRVEAWLIRHLYPNIWLCTNHPEYFLGVQHVVVPAKED